MSNGSITATLAMIRIDLSNAKLTLKSEGASNRTDLNSGGAAEHGFTTPSLTIKQIHIILFFIALIIWGLVSFTFGEWYGQVH